jgi:DNA-binding transcriptional LysR family regulator
MLQRKQQSETPDLEELQAFVAIAAQGSLTGAARRLGLPKSTVSRRLSRLEEKVGVALVHRTTRRLSLTESGLVYRERVAPALAALDEARSALREQHETPRGHLRVTAPFDLGLTTLAPLVGAFLQRWPETSVEVLLTERLLDLVEERIDLAVRAAASLPDSSLSARRLAGVSLVLVATPQHLARHRAPPSPDGRCCSTPTWRAAAASCCTAPAARARSP